MIGVYSMNLIEASIRLGKELKKNDYGQKLLLKYHQAKNNVSDESWRMFLNILNRYIFIDNVNPFKMAIEYLSMIKNENNNILHREINEILESCYLRNLCDFMDTFFKNNFELSLNIIGNLSNRNYPNIENNIKIQRKIVDLQSTYLNTQISNYFLYYTTNDMEKVNRMTEISKRIENENFIGFSLKNYINTIKELMKVYDEKEIIMASQFSAIPKIINRGIYCGILDLIYEIPIEGILKFKEKKLNSFLSIFSVKLINTITPFIYDRNNMYIFEILVGDDKKYIFCNGANIQLDEMMPTRIFGFIYPNIEKCVYCY